MVRKDAVERRTQADWVRDIARIIDGTKPLPRLTLTPSEIADGWRIETVGNGGQIKVHGPSGLETSDL